LRRPDTDYPDGALLRTVSRAFRIQFDLPQTLVDPEARAAAFREAYTKFYQSINQSINRINQSINQSMASINQSINLVNQSISQSINQSINNHSINQSHQSILCSGLVRIFSNTILTQSTSVRHQIQISLGEAAEHFIYSASGLLVFHELFNIPSGVVTPETIIGLAANIDSHSTSAAFVLNDITAPLTDEQLAELQSKNSIFAKAFTIYVHSTECITPNRLIAQALQSGFFASALLLTVFIRC